MFLSNIVLSLSLLVSNPSIPEEKMEELWKTLQVSCQIWSNEFGFDSVKECVEANKNEDVLNLSKFYVINTCTVLGNDKFYDACVNHGIFVRDWTQKDGQEWYQGMKQILLSAGE